MYLPASGMPIGGHRFAHGDLDTLVTAIAGVSSGSGSSDGMLWDAERSVSAAGGDAAGTTVIRSVTKLVATPVTSVSADDVPDTQRRRAQSLAVSYRKTLPIGRPV
jgi:hypothetical protein